MTLTTTTTEDQRPTKRPRQSSESQSFQVPTFAGDLSSIVNSEDFATSWETYQLAFLPRQDLPKAECFTWKDIYELFRKLSQKDKDSFCFETASRANNKSDSTLSSLTPDPHLFFRHDINLPVETASMAPKPPYYSSFLVQNDESSLNTLLTQVPVSTVKAEWSHEPCVWIFFGRNPSDHDSSTGSNGQNLQGRPEHTDSVSHDGTWHYQLSGIKRWLLRPTSKLLEHWTMLGKKQNGHPVVSWDESSPDARITIQCQEGDILVINTRLWFHQTILPPQPDPSVSYARDFWVQPKSTPPDTTSESGPANESGGCMTNVDGLYATEDIAEGTILFREMDMPDCELHRSKDNPNCEVVELDDGTCAVVSSRPIVAGEFFCIAESEDEDDDDEDGWEDQVDEDLDEEGVESDEDEE